MAKQRRNSVVPVNRLPAEMLRCIFSHVRRIAWDAYDYAGAYRWLYLTFVCSRWRGIALGDQSLWRMVMLDTYTNQACLSEVLRRSGNASLIVCIAVLDAKDLSSRMKTFFQQPTQIEHLTLDMPSPDKALEGLNSALGQLKTLIIRNTLYGHDSTAAIAKLSNIDLPKLIDITFDTRVDSFPTLRGFLPSCLTRLKVRVAVVPSIADLDSTLSAFPALEELEIDTGRDNVNSIYTDYMILMQRLRILEVAGTTMSCVFLLNFIAVPQSTSVRVKPIDATQLQDRFLLGQALREKVFGELIPVPDTVWRIDEAAGGIKLSIWFSRPSSEQNQEHHDHPTPWSGLSDPAPPIAEVTLPSEGPSLELFCSAFGLLDVRVLVIDSISATTATRWCSLFFQMECVQALYFTRQRNTHSHILRWLRRRVSQLSPCVIFPGLKALHLVQTCFYTTRDTEPSKPHAVFWDDVKETLLVRRDQGSAVDSLVLDGATGLREEDVYKMAGVVNEVMMNVKRFKLKS